MIIKPNTILIKKQKNPIQEPNYKFLIETNTSKDKNIQFDFNNAKRNDGWVFAIGAVFVPFLINIILTYSITHLSRLIPMLISIFFASSVLGYLLSRNGKSFFRNGGLAFFWMILFMPIITFILTIIIAHPIISHYKWNANPSSTDVNTNALGLETLMQVLAEIISIVGIFLLDKKLWKRFINTYKDGWYFPIIVFLGTFGIYLLTFIFGLIPISSSSSNNQDSLNKLLDSVWTIILLGVFTILVAPVMEELTTRNGIFLLTGNKWLGFVTASVYFAGMHVNQSGDWNNILDYLGAGIGLSLIFMFANGNPAYDISSHSILNIISFTTLLIQHHPH